MDSTPLKISVVTPSYNQGQFIEATIQSVLSQDYPHVEYFVIDGGSADESASIIEKYASQLKYWCSEPDEGQADAIGKGFDLCTGDILCWLNSDDLLLPGALSAVAKFFSDHPKIDAVSGGGFYVDESGRPYRRGFGTCSLGVAATANRFRFLQAQDGVFQMATFWRREAYLAVGGIDRSLQFIMDLDLFTRLAQRSRFGRLPELLACFRLHDACKTRCWHDVRLREGADYDRRYRVDQHHATTRFLMRWRYRLPSLLRKCHLRLLQATRQLSIPPQ